VNGHMNITIIRIGVIGLQEWSIVGFPFHRVILEEYNHDSPSV
jgi:hypothetical protein